MALGMAAIRLATVSATYSVPLAQADAGRVRRPARPGSVRSEKPEPMTVSSVTDGLAA